MWGVFEMFVTGKSRLVSFFILFAITFFTTKVGAYDGSETWLHYTAVSTDLQSAYGSVCQSIVMSDAESDTLKNAKAELDLAMPKLLGGSALPVADAVAAGAIVLAPEGSPLVTDAGIDFTAINSEGFIIKSAGGATYISGKNEVGVLRGVFAFLRHMQMGKEIASLNIAETPYFSYRVLDHWYHHYGSTTSYKAERTYGGKGNDYRVFKMERFGSLNQEGAERTMVINYCRMAASLGLNGVTPDCVNTVTMGSVNWQVLQENNLKNQKVFADIIGTYGLKYFLTVSYNSPQLIGGISSDPRQAATKQWWKDRVDMVVGYISNFGGFLFKADSESETGPLSVFNSDQATGSSPLAEALKGRGVCIWRTFIYSSNKNDDFAVTQMQTFTGKKWNENVILRMKDGPRDFQIVEPPNYIATMGGARLGMELQVTQEYTGQDKHVCWLVPRWKQVFDNNMVGADIREGVKGTKMHQILTGDNTMENGGGLWGISNLSNATNWTGHYLHQANAYGYGRLAWNPLLSADEIANEWIHCSFATGDNPEVQYLVNDILQKSWKTYEDYTISYSALMPAVCWNDHYEIEFNKDDAGFRTRFFMGLENDGIGVNRTSNASSFLSYLPKQLADSLGNIATCPEDYLLFFHHCQWEYKMKSGMTLIQSLHHNHFRGIRQVKRFINNWKMLQGTIDSDIYTHVLQKLNTQLTDGSRWANTFRSQFGGRYNKAVGCDLEIMVPDEGAALTADVGSAVSLTARYADQTGKDVGETINWSVARIHPNGSLIEGGTLSAAQGQSVEFSSDDDGIYRVTASTATFPDLKDQLQVFVGDWAKVPPVGVRKSTINRLVKQKMLLSLRAKGVAIKVPFAGTIDIVGLNGRIVKSIAAGKAGIYRWNTHAAGAGLYIVRLTDQDRSLQSRLLVK
jgi:alpha-glucuronidase